MPSIGLLVLIPRTAAPPLVGLDRCYVHLDPRSGHPIQDGSFIPKDEDALCDDTVAAAAFGRSVADLGLEGVSIDALTAEVSTANLPAHFARVELDPSSGLFRASVDPALLERPRFVEDLIRAFALPSDRVLVEPDPCQVDEWLALAGLLKADAVVRYDRATSRLEVVDRAIGAVKAVDRVSGAVTVVHLAEPAAEPGSSV